jgi:hypothetical protein
MAKMDVTNKTQKLTDMGQANSALAFNNFTTSKANTLAKTTTKPETVQRTIPIPLWKTANKALLEAAQIALIYSSYRFVESAWKLSRVKEPKGSSEYKRAEENLKQQVKIFAESHGEKNIENIRITPRPANNIIVTNEQRHKDVPNFGSLAYDITYDSTNFFGIPSENKFTLWAQLGPHARLSDIYADTQSGRKTPLSLQTILRVGLAEWGMQGHSAVKGAIDAKGHKWIGARFSVVVRPPHFKDVKDYSKVKKFTEDPSFNMGITMTGNVDLYLASAGPFFEFGRILAAPDINGKRRPFHVLDKCNVRMSPAGYELWRDKAPAFIADPIETAVNIGFDQTAVASIIRGGVSAAKWAAPKVKWVAQKVGLKTIVTKIAPKAAPVIIGLGESSNLLGWIAAGLIYLKNNYDDDQYKKAKYKETVQQLVNSGAYRPNTGLNLYLKQVMIDKNLSTGDMIQLMSDVVDTAFAQKLIKNPQALRTQWGQELNYVGGTKLQTYMGRMIAAGVLGKGDLVEKNGALISNIISQQDYINMWSTMAGYMVKNSKALAKIKSPTQDPKLRTLTKEGYRSFKAKLMGGTFTATPGQVGDKGHTTWSITLTTADGLTATLNAGLKKQFTLKDIAYATPLHQTLIRMIQAEREKLPKLTTTYKPYTTKLNGQTFTAKFIRTTANGNSIWQVKGKSDNGIPVEIYGEVKGQFGAANFKPKSPLRLKAEAIMRGETP